jgi:hypothetical protein
MTPATLGVRAGRFKLTLTFEDETSSIRSKRMTPERYARLSELFAEARLKPKADWGEFIKHACADDPDLAALALKYLENDHLEPLDSLLGRPLPPSNGP